MSAQKRSPSPVRWCTVQPHIGRSLFLHARGAATSHGVILRSGTGSERTQQKLSSNLKPLTTMAVEPRRRALPPGAVARRRCSGGLSPPASSIQKPRAYSAPTRILSVTARGRGARRGIRCGYNARHVNCAASRSLHALQQHTCHCRHSTLTSRMRSLTSSREWETCDRVSAA